MSFTGEILLAVVFILSGFSASFALVASMLPQKPALLLIRQVKIAVAAAVFFCIAVFLLFESAFLLDNFSIAVVAQYSHSAMNIFYKLSAAWAGAAGSLLLWTVLTFLFNSVALIGFESDNHKMTASSLAVGSIVNCCFAGLLLFVVKPFASTLVTTDQGIGLNPLLQNFWNVIHPPLLFIGYAGLGVAFVIVTAFTFSSENNIAKYKPRIKSWLLFGLLFLSLGIATGARWSYKELGWGGYWAWDPVENASLLPWFAAVAALHCIICINRNRTFKFWATILTPLGFTLSVLATFITRSGILQSVHAFGKNPMFAVLSVLLAVIFIVWLICIFKAAKIFITGKQSQNNKTNDLILWGVWLMMVSALIIAVATFWPIVSKLITAEDSGAVLTRSFYDRVIGAVAVLLVLMIAAKEASLLIKTKGKFFLFISSAIGIFAAMLSYYFSDQAIISIVFGICVSCFAIIRFKQYITKFKTRLAGDIAHFGFLLLVVSAAFASLERVGQFQLQKGSPQIIEGRTVTFTEFKRQKVENLMQSGPVIVLDRDGKKKTLFPCENVYPSGQVTSEVAVSSSLLEDVYVIYENIISQDEVIITIKFIPMMSWLWLSAILIVTGFGWSLFEKRRLS